MSLVFASVMPYGFVDQEMSEVEHDAGTIDDHPRKMMRTLSAPVSHTSDNDLTSPVIIDSSLAIAKVKGLRRAHIRAAIERFRELVEDAERSAADDIDDMNDVEVVMVAGGVQPSDLSRLSGGNIDELRSVKLSITEGGSLVMTSLPTMARQCAKFELYRQVGNYLVAQGEAVIGSGNVSRDGEFGGRAPDVIIYPRRAYGPEYRGEHGLGAVRLAIEVHRCGVQS